MKIILYSFGILFLLAELVHSAGLGEIIYALNAGGESFTDSHGIRYRRDYLTVGTASDYGRALDIKRAHFQDKILYQTERYATETFGYTIPMPASDGDYVLWLKFSEVWFNAPNLKVFDVALNDMIVAKDLDIFERVGRGVAHDEVIPFQVRQNKIIISGKASQFNSEIRVEFIKTDRDNPKINAIIVMKGTPDQVPPLPAYKPERQYDDFDEDEREERSEDRSLEDEDFESDNDEQLTRMKRARMDQMREEEERENERVNQRKKQVTTPPTPKVVDPYSSDETSYLIPILVAIGAFIPLLFCLCKL